MPILRAVVWRRFDFQESSRIVSLITRNEGRIQVLAKGAHRPGSPFLGRIDFLNLVDATVAGKPGTLRLLSRVHLVHEPRALREPARFAAATWLSELMDVAFFESRSDPAMFELLVGGLALLEKCPESSLRSVVAGLELRYLQTLGQLPDLERCAQCGRQGRLQLDPDGHGLVCRDHAGPGARAPHPGALSWLATIHHHPGKDWPSLPPGRSSGPALAVLGGWIEAAIERRPRMRAQALTSGRVRAAGAAEPARTVQ